MIILTQQLTTDKRRKRRMPVGSSAVKQMEEIVGALNGPRPKTRRPGQTVPSIVRLEPSADEIELQKLVKRWMESGPNLKKLFSEEPALANQIKQGEMVMFPGPKGRGYLEWTPGGADEHPASRNDRPIQSHEVLRHFFALITNPEWSLLAEPCPNCGDYFLREFKHPKIYCSRICSSTFTAKLSMKESRERLHVEMVERAKASIIEFQKTKTKTPWKKWVGSRTSLTPSWLTRAVNKGYLQEPIATLCC